MRYVAVSEKPRIVKTECGWMCFGLTKKAWCFGSQQTIIRYGVNPLMAFNTWLSEAGYVNAPKKASK